MLVISRTDKHNKNTLIFRHCGEEVRLEVLGVRGKTVRLGIHAAKSVAIIRAELEIDEDETGQTQEPALCP